MTPQSTSGKTSRSYRSELRQQQAEQTRTRVVAPQRNSSPPRVMRAPPSRKSRPRPVSPPKPSKATGPKAALIIAAVEYAAFGVSGEDNVFNLDVGRRILAVDDPTEAADALAAMHSEIFERIAHLALALIGAASSDPELDRYLTDVFASVNLQLRRILGVYRDRGWLREDVPFDELVETAAVLG